MTDETPTVIGQDFPEGALVQIRVHPQSTRALRIRLNGAEWSVIGPGQGVIGILHDNRVESTVATLEPVDFWYITAPTNPDGLEGGPVPAQAEAPRIALV